MGCRWLTFSFNFKHTNGILRSEAPELAGRKCVPPPPGGALRWSRVNGLQVWQGTDHGHPFCLLQCLLSMLLLLLWESAHHYFSQLPPARSANSWKHLHSTHSLAGLHLSIYTHTCQKSSMISSLHTSSPSSPSLLSKLRSTRLQRWCFVTVQVTKAMFSNRPAAMLWRSNDSVRDPEMAFGDCGLASRVKWHHRHRK